MRIRTILPLLIILSTLLDRAEGSSKSLREIFLQKEESGKMEYLLEEYEIALGLEERKNWWNLLEYPVWPVSRINDSLESITEQEDIWKNSPGGKSYIFIRRLLKNLLKNISYFKSRPVQEERLIRDILVMIGHRQAQLNQACISRYRTDSHYDRLSPERTSFVFIRKLELELKYFLTRDKIGIKKEFINKLIRYEEIDREVQDEMEKGVYTENIKEVASRLSEASKLIKGILEEFSREIVHIPDKEISQKFIEKIIIKTTHARSIIRELVDKEWLFVPEEKSEGDSYVEISFQYKRLSRIQFFLNSISELYTPEVPENPSINQNQNLDYDMGLLLCTELEEEAC